MNRINTEAIVLKNYNLKEMDKIYTLLTKDVGLISATGKGVRKISSKRGSNLDTLNHVQVSISTGKNGYKTITEVSTINSFKKLKTQLDTHQNMYYLLELVYRFMDEGEKNEELFNLFVNTLLRISSSKSKVEILLVINIFELKLMRLLGYELTLDKCVNCEKSFSEDWRRCKFSVVDGGFICEDCFKGGAIINMDVAMTLNYINGKSLGKSSLESSLNKKSFLASNDSLITANDLIKFYIKEVLEDGFKSTRVFNS